MTHLYRCDLCGKTKDYLSDSWSEITVALSDGQSIEIHHCLECRSEKKEYRP